MSNSLTVGINLGPAYAGLSDLRAQLRDATGSNVGSAISTGFFEIGGGCYQWTNSFTTGFQGTITFYSTTTPQTTYFTVAYDPQEVESNPVTVAAIGTGAITPSSFQNGNYTGVTVSSTGSAGTGAFPVTVTVSNGSSALTNANIRFSIGSNSYTNSSDSSGLAAFSLDAGTYTLSASQLGYTYTPVAEHVTAPATYTVTMTALTQPGPSGTPGTVNAFLYCYDQAGNTVSGQQVLYRLIAAPPTLEGSTPDSTYTATSDNTGTATFSALIQGIYQYWSGNGLPSTVLIPLNASNPYELGSIIS